MIGAVKKRTTAFLLSDFIDNHDYTQALSICSNKHDLTALQVYDKRDTTLPRVGLVKASRRRDRRHKMGKHQFEEGAQRI